MRLDICTSGLLLFSRSPESAKRFTTATQAVKQVQQACALPSFLQVHGMTNLIFFFFTNGYWLACTAGAQR
jgi:hypothetical protein